MFHTGWEDLFQSLPKVDHICVLVWTDEAMVSICIIVSITNISRSYITAVINLIMLHESRVKASSIVNT